MERTREGVRPPVRVREMTRSDIDAVSSIRVRGWQAAYPGIVPQPYLDGMSVEEDARARRGWFGKGAARDLVSVNEADEPTGWACWGPYRDESEPAGRPTAGEMYALYVRPDLVGRGLGRSLLEAAQVRAAAEGFTTLCLWVLTANTRARRFYEAAGYVTDGTSRTDTYGGTVVPELLYRKGRSA